MSFSEQQIRKIVRDELHIILDTGLMYTAECKEKPQSTSPSVTQPNTATAPLPSPSPPQNTLQIKNLQDGMKRVSIKAKVVEKTESREVITSQGPTQTAYAVIADESGNIKLSLWDNQISEVNVSENIVVENGYVSSFKGELQLNVGKFGKLLIL
jgi:replication factor A1